MPITINGSGTLTGISAGGLPDGVITTDDIAAGAVTTAKLTGGPAFSARRSVAQTGVSANTLTKVQLNSEDFDTANCFDSSTNFRFTPNVAGYYQFNAVIEINNIASSYEVMIFKNGGIWAQAKYYNSTTSGSNGALSSLVFLNGSSDYVELYGRCNTGSQAFYEMSTLSGFLARPA